MAVLREFPPEFVSKLIESDHSEIARQWAAAMSTSEFTHSVTGAKLNDGWTRDQALQILIPIVAVARKASPGESMYLLIEA